MTSEYRMRTATGAKTCQAPKTDIIHKMSKIRLAH
jgi:hypothetical protein